MDNLQFSTGTLECGEGDIDPKTFKITSLTLVHDGSGGGQPEGTITKQILTAKVSSTLDASRDHMRVYKVQLFDGQTPYGPAVCKVASDVCIQSLRDELRWYQTKLKDLQGTVVPKIYGLYVGWVGGELVHVLLEQFCGLRFKNIGNLPKDDRMDILVAALKIHAAGLKHNNISLNILPGLELKGAASGPRIAGFDKATDHKCPMVERLVNTHGVFKAEDIKKDIEQFGKDCIVHNPACLELRILWCILGFQNECGYSLIG